MKKNDTAQYIRQENDKELLKERAVKLARKITSDEAGAEAARIGRSKDYVQFSLGLDAYAFDTSVVKEVLETEDIVSVPCTPDFITGVISVRGHICPVIDLRAFLGLSGGPERPFLAAVKKVLVLSSSEMKLAVLIDEVTDVFSVQNDDIKPRAAGNSGSDRFSVGTINAKVVVLDGVKLLDASELIVNEVVNGSMSLR
ncbi:chemotaxis protein CheW [Desulfovibrio gilichinskyi]|uniref:CheW protein n=1 Tax=Desulfovibrio gilichinskyi TaxID=1519643 RepID=A0A1X7C0I2_9BACT|nr:chemotaxis protein CheW [Desulfovibrio gilichinskyi]SME87767.1 CheW protein [Desulfovibrio gilichinskyi]